MRKVFSLTLILVFLLVALIPVAVFAQDEPASPWDAEYQVLLPLTEACHTVRFHGGADIPIIRSDMWIGSRLSTHGALPGYEFAYQFFEDGDRWCVENKYYSSEDSYEQAHCTAYNRCEVYVLMLFEADGYDYRFCGQLLEWTGDTRDLTLQHGGTNCPDLIPPGDPISHED